MALPIALAGGTVATWAAGDTFTLGSLLGLLAVGGVATRSSTVLLSGYQQLERGDPRLGRLAAVRRGTIERGMSTGVAALVTAVAFLPFVAIGSVPGTEIVRPLAISVLGGLFTTTLLALVILPAGYLVGRDRRPAEPPAPADPGADRLVAAPASANGITNGATDDTGPAGSPPDVIPDGSHGAGPAPLPPGLVPVGAPDPSTARGDATKDRSEPPAESTTVVSFSPPKDASDA